MCDKTANGWFLVFIYTSDQYKTQETCNRVISEGPFMVVYCPGRYKSQRKCDEAVEDCLAALEFISDWFVTSRMLEKLDNALHSNDDILFHSEDLDKVTFIANQRNILAANLDKINLDHDNKLDEDDPDTIIHISLLAGPSKFRKREALKKRNKRRINVSSVTS